MSQLSNAIFVSIEYIKTDKTDDILIKQGWRGNVVNLDCFILILMITNQYLCKYIYIFETYITCKAGDIYGFFK